MNKDIAEGYHIIDFHLLTSWAPFILQFTG